MDNIKISANFTLPGSVLDYEYQTSEMTSIELYNPKKNKTEVLTYRVAKCKPCTQNINMTEEAYQYMLETPVKPISANHWKRLSIKQKVVEHLKEIQANLRATSFTFTIYND